MAYLCRASYLSESYSSDTRDGSNFSRLTSHQSPNRPSHRSRKHPHQRPVLDFEEESDDAYRGRGTGTRRSTTAAGSSRLAACPNSHASSRAASSSARWSLSPPDYSPGCRLGTSVAEQVANRAHLKRILLLCGPSKLGPNVMTRAAQRFQLPLHLLHLHSIS